MGKNRNRKYSKANEEGWSTVGPAPLEIESGAATPTTDTTTADQNIDTLVNQPDPNLSAMAGSKETNISRQKQEAKLFVDKTNVNLPSTNEMEVLEKMTGNQYIQSIQKRIARNKKKLRKIELLETKSFAEETLTQEESLLLISKTELIDRGKSYDTILAEFERFSAPNGTGKLRVANSDDELISKIIALEKALVEAKCLKAAEDERCVAAPISTSKTELKKGRKASTKVPAIQEEGNKGEVETDKSSEPVNVKGSINQVVQNEPASGVWATLRADPKHTVLVALIGMLLGGNGYLYYMLEDCRAAMFG